MSDTTLVSQYDGTLVKAGDQYVRVDKGGAVPQNADADHVKVLKERGMVAEGEVASGFVTDPDTPPPFKVAEGSGSDDSGDDSDSVPAKSASRADWDAYAKTKGLSDDEIASYSTKEDLQKHFGVE